MKLNAKSGLLLFALIAGLLIGTPADTHATLAGFDPGRIMDDAVMANKNTMTEAQIQSFLKSKNSCNDSDYAKYQQYTNAGFTYNWQNGHFVCMADESFNGESAARIIWQAGQDYGINPQVLIVLLQKEQGLVTDTWPNSNQYRGATGFGCPDTAPCDAEYYGFKNQVRKAANLFSSVLGGGWSNYPVGINYVQYNPNPDCGGSNLNIQNRATSSLYRYTPYQPNSGALAAGWGTATCGAYGNRNFYNYFTSWFGATRSDGESAIAAKYISLGGSSSYLGEQSSQVTCGLRSNGCYQTFQGGSIYWSPVSGAWNIHGSVRSRWQQLGFENGYLGYPTSGEIAIPGGGVYQRFQGGQMYWTSGTGAWDIHWGDMFTRYNQLGKEGGVLGYPTSGEIAIPGGGVYQTFQGGRLTWDPKMIPRVTVIYN